MGTEREFLDHNPTLFESECTEPDGTVNRGVRLCILSPEKLRFLYTKLSKFDILFGEAETEEEKMQRFLDTFIEVEGDTIRPRGLIWEVDDVGIFYITDIRYGHSAQGHYSFWDGRFRGREQLCRDFLRYLFETFHFRKIEAQIPYYAYRTFHTVEKIGFTKDGRIRKEAYYDGKWFDVAYFSILREEVIDDGIRSQDGEDLERVPSDSSSGESTSSSARAAV